MGRRHRRRNRRNRGGKTKPAKTQVVLLVRPMDLSEEAEAELRQKAVMELPIKNGRFRLLFSDYPGAYGQIRENDPQVVFLAIAAEWTDEVSAFLTSIQHDQAVRSIPLIYLIHDPLADEPPIRVGDDEFENNECLRDMLRRRDISRQNFC
jgi:hypothetical protein